MKLVGMSVEGFLGELASGSPAPGGGSAAALAGAVAAALCGMVARLTGGREKLRDAWPAMAVMREEADRLRARLAALVDEDAEAFNAVMAAQRLPRATEAEKAARSAAMAAASLRAARVPLETLAAMGPLARLAGIAVESGSPGCVTDAGAAAAIIGAAARAAAYNVRVNLPSLADPVERVRMDAEAEAALAAAWDAVQAIDRIVEARLKERSGS